jgi:hypothetical protein
VIRALLLLLASMLPLGAAANDRAAYAREWPLQLAGEPAGVHRVVLAPEVYRSAHLASLDDVSVLDALGMPVPAALFAGDAVQAPTVLQSLPWFALPRPAAARERELAMVAERDAAGRLHRLEARLHDAPGAPDAGADAWLVDARRVHAAALVLHWPDDAPPFEAAYRLDGSDDLQAWQALVPRVNLLSLARDGQVLRQARIPLPRSARFLRLLPLQGDAVPALARVDAEIAGAAVDPGWRWREHRTTAVHEQGRVHYEIELDGRFPVTRVDVVAPGNDAREWLLSTRDRRDGAWRQRSGPWLSYRLGDAAGARTPPHALSSQVRDRYWRLTPASPVAEAPVLRLGYRPEAIVFVASGTAPYTLAAGSARARRPAAPVAATITALETASPGWRPADARLGAARVLAADAALRPARDWKAWLLWSALALGALLVAGLAVALLRGAGGRRQAGPGEVP